MTENFLQDHGPLLAHYHTWGDGQALEGENPGEDRWSPDNSVNPSAQFPRSGRMMYDFISEGDSPAYFYLLDFNGLRSAEDPTWGGWDGRFAPNASGWIDTSDVNTFTGAMDRSFPQTRWVPALQADFAARADWGVSPNYADANHVPGTKVAPGLDLNRKVGSKGTLNGWAKDPDGDAVTYKWWQYTEAGTYPGTVEIVDADSSKASIFVPADAQLGETTHLIMEVTDNGSPALTKYERVVITVSEDNGYHKGQ